MRGGTQTLTIGSAARLLGRVRLLLRLGSSEGSVFGRLSLVPPELFMRFGSLGVYASYVYPEGAPMLSSCLYALWVCDRIHPRFHSNLATLCASSRCDFILCFWFFVALKVSQTFPANGIDHSERLWWLNQEHLFSVTGGKIFVGRR